MKYIVKRIIDIFLSLALLVLFFPLLIVISMAILITMGRPILFRQTRTGQANREFKILKFRSMKDATDSNGVKLADSLRISALGKFLRRSSLDELPELINILLGDMSLVGPRPLLPKYLPLYSKTQLKRHKMRPGLTGLAQVSGRNNLTWDKKFEYDVDYIETFTVWLDIKIMFRTILVVLSRENINPDGMEKMPSWQGNERKQ